MIFNDMKFDCFAVSDTGKWRPQNEDAFICDPENAVFLVADGMGGEEYGEVASQLTADHFTKLILPFVHDEDITIPFDHSRDEDLFSGIMRHAVEGTNSAVVEYASEHLSHRGMGSTLTAAIFYKEFLYIAHVGDSRLYKIDSEKIHQVTEDHTRVQEMVREGVLSKEEARIHPNRNIITRCIGRRYQSNPDIFRLEISDDEVFLICSDGLNDMVTDQEIHAVVDRSDTLEEAGKKLIEVANRNGGKDNITVVLFRVYT